MFALVPSTDPALRTVSRAVRPDEIPNLRKQLYWLQKLMKKQEAGVKAPGIGLAANQVGDCRRYFVWDVGMCINPEITSASTFLDRMDESCLSFPGVVTQCERPRSILVRFLDERGITIERGYDGRSARIFQHELDHLNGLCIA